MIIDEAAYLRPDVKIEPLVCQWHAWPHLIPPLQRGLNLLNRYLPALRSFLTNPRVHVTASANPALFGGPFVDLSLEKVSQVKDLQSTIELEQRQLTNLASDFLETERSLIEIAHGYSLNEHYATTPPSLAGAVEYVYDLNNRPAVRLIEPLIYDKNPPDSSQTIFLHATPEEKRPFFLNTPRLSDEQNLMVEIPFHDPRIDALAKSRFSPSSPKSLAALLGIVDSELDKFARLFTCEPNRVRYDPPSDGSIRFRYFGHATILIESSTTAILIDPVIAYEEGADDGRLTQADLPERIDYLVITHCHQDHFSPETLLQIRYRVRAAIVPHNNSGSLSDPAMSLILESLGYSQVITLDEFGCLNLADGKIVSLPFLGEHSDLHIHSKHSVLVELGGIKSLFLVDSDIRDAELMQFVRHRAGEVDFLFMGMECNGAPLTWLYGPLLSNPISRQNDESRRLSASDAAGAIMILKCFPEAEFFIYAMGQEPWLKFMMGLEYTEESFQIQQINQFRHEAAALGKDVTVLNQVFERTVLERNRGSDVSATTARSVTASEWI